MGEVEFRRDGHKQWMAARAEGGGVGERANQRKEDLLRFYEPR